MGYEYKDPPKSIIFDAIYQEIVVVFKLYLCSLLFFFHSFVGYGQSMLDVAFNYYEDSTRKIKPFPTENLKIDSLLLNKYINQRLNNLYEFGYLAATYKQVYFSKAKIDVQFITHQEFEIVKLSKGNVSEEIIHKIGIDPQNLVNRPFSNQKLVRLLNEILDYAENHGYPFAAVKLDSISINDLEVGGWLNYNSGPMVVFDSVILSGYDKVKAMYLMNHLGIYQGKPYEEQLVKEIPNKMKLLPFITLNNDPEIIISEGKCKIYLNLAQRKVSKLDGILGILPNQKNGESLLITGQVNLDLYNLFSSGKRLALEWQSYDANSQLLNMLYYHPNLFRTPLNAQGDFHLLKQDTTFINREFALELSLLSKRSNKIGFRTELIASRLISTSGLEDITELPANSDYNLNYYGLNYLLNRLNDINFPKRGWRIFLSGLISQKKIIKNSRVNDVVYENIKLNDLQYKFYGEIEKFWVVHKNIVCRTGIIGGRLFADNLFQSDLFRVGGLKTLRGFAENQFYTSGYGVANIELRALFSNETYFMIFFDQGIIAENVASHHDLEYPFGTGAGFSFSTNAGVFNLVFALGKASSQPFGLDHAKIHFGYISRF